MNQSYQPDYPFITPAASAFAAQTDKLFLTLAGLALCIAAIIATVAIVFCFRYRAGSRASRAGMPINGRGLEWAWTILPALAFLALFAWSAHQYSALTRTPADAARVYVVARQWVWHLEHANGRREVDQLHLPAGKPVQLIMTSQDVIHSFFVPAFRVKRDVVPNRYETLWFVPEKAGHYRLFCAEYCGTNHATMAGGVIVMEPEDYSRWLQGGAAGQALRARGAALFRERGCIGCHSAQSTVHAPDLNHIYGRRIPLSDGSMAVADETYLRDAILEPKKQIAAGYPDIMPSFAGMLSDEEVNALVEFLRDPGRPALEPTP